MTNPKFVVKRIDRFELGVHNTNNYPIDSISRPDIPKYSLNDYNTELQKTHLNHFVQYMNKLSPDNAWQKIHLSDNLFNLLKRYNETSHSFGMLKFSEENPQNELWNGCDELANSKLFDSGQRWFFRFASNSPKDGTPNFPVLSEYDVIEKIVTSSRASYALENGDNVLYFKKFRDDYNIANEMRVFVYNGNITAISSYTDDYTDFAALSNSKLKKIMYKIHRFWAGLEFHDKLPDSYVMDIFIPDNILYQHYNTIELLEFNSFGYWLASGACLFDWINDFDILYGDGNSIEYRLMNF